MSRVLIIADLHFSASASLWRRSSSSRACFAASSSSETWTAGDGEVSFLVHAGIKIMIEIRAKSNAVRGNLDRIIPPNAVWNLILEFSLTMLSYINNIT